MSGNPTTPLPSVRVLWRPEQFNRVTNGTFETNTTGWVTTAGINAAGTSITRVTTDSHSGSASATVVCTSTDTSGVNFDMGANRYFSEASYGSMYAAVVWLKRVSGSRRARVTLGSLGTSTDRATLTITDLTDQWQPYVVRWLPTGTRTDVELAVTNGSAEALTFRLDDVAVYLVDAFSQCENGTFEVDTTGWSVSAGTFAAAATSITRTAGGFGGSYCGRLVTTASASSGATYSLSGRTFVSGRTYRARIATKTVSGSTGFTLTLGRTGDSASTSITAGASFAWATVDWTPAADRTDVEVGIYSSGSSVRTVDVDELEVYEAVDDLGTDAGAMTWNRSLDAVGTITVEVENADGRYDPRYASSPLYGSCEPGRRIWGRATYGGALYPLFYGTLATIEAAPMGGVHATLIAEDMLGTLRDADVFSDFAQNDSFRRTRSWVIDSVVSMVPPIAESPASGVHESLAEGIESGNLFRGTDGEVPALDLLADFNEATGTVHWIEPSVHANIGWRYTTQDRATFTDTSSDFTVDETDPPTDLTGIRTSADTLENRQEVPWQTYTVLPTPGSDPSGYGYVMLAVDPDTYGTLGLGADAPYLTYTRDDYGTDDNHPDARWRYGGLGRKKWRERKRRGLKFPRRTRVYPDPFVPTTFAAGEVRRYVFDFAIPISGPQVTYDGTTGATGILLDYIEQRPNRLVVELRAVTADDINLFGVVGTPWQPGDEQTETVVAYDSQLARGNKSGPTIGTGYIPAPGLAAGLGAYRNWRYSTGRMAPQMYDRNNFPRTLTADLTDHFTITADRWRISSVLFASVGCRWEVSAGGLDWRAWHDLEELPSHTDWFTLDDATKGLDDAVVLAY
jgi:hypothetical protein